MYVSQSKRIYLFLKCLRHIYVFLLNWTELKDTKGWVFFVKLRRFENWENPDKWGRRAGWLSSWAPGQMRQPHLSPGANIEDKLFTVGKKYNKYTERQICRSEPWYKYWKTVLMVWSIWIAKLSLQLPLAELLYLHCSFCCLFVPHR